MTSWSRVTLVGERRRVDAVLPAQEPIGALLPEVLELLGDPVENPPRLRHLTTSSGVILDGDTTLADKGVLDGAVLRLVSADDPLPAPVVHEVPETVSDALDGHRGRWTPDAARWTATAAATVLSLALGGVVWRGVGGSTGLWAVTGAAAPLFVLGPLLGRFWKEPLGTALSIAGGALGGLALWFAVELHGLPDWVRWGGMAAIASLLVLGLGLSRLGRAGLVGGGLALLLTVLWSASAALGLDASRIAAGAAIACVVLLSVLLRTALALSGLSVLDDRRSTGAEVSRADVMSALTDAHRSMVIATAAVAVFAAAAGMGLATEFTGWTAALCVLLAIVVASRSRMFPLVVEKASLLAAAVVVLVAPALAWAGDARWAVWPAAGVLGIALVFPVMALMTDPPEHVRARLRRIAGQFEAVALVALVPVALGVFGTYQRLLDTF
ncbi:type VII secretion integral membrane protein EccD [Thermobifida halotolerans]|uniref:Type VII secretion integral membrane protein EccD n=1 Tax=Thermobifida halotolerans TaxID=483545 RepID=A0A399G2C5_9ACTN|nr:type VII secretion integral membrane protein EccD [Thermobifida halotolerans]UOE19107.1 type VII secretion integral membrane protein EccD [Thermobifida halotolerans]